MLSRRDSSGDRRRLTLKITSEGRQALAQSRAETQKCLAAMLSGLDAQEIVTITRAMQTLHRVFAVPARTAGAVPARTSGRRPSSNGNS